MAAVNHARSAISKLSIKNSAFFFCDMQDKFQHTVSYFPQILKVNQRMLEAGKILGVPMIATEQYPKGLGNTVPELNLKDAGVPVFEKTCFTMMGNEVTTHLKETAPDCKSVILSGIEAHACIFQTTMDLLNLNYDVHLIVDGISSRNPVDRMFAFKQMEKSGAILTTSECLLLSLLRDAKHPKFREVQKLLMEVSPDSNLLVNKA